MKHQAQTELPGVVAVVETITCRGHELEHLAETLKAQGKRIITMTAVCQSSWRCTIATLPEAAGQAASLPTAQALAANQSAMRTGFQGVLFRRCARQSDLSLHRKSANSTDAYVGTTRSR